MKKWPDPHNSRELWSFLGLASYYWQFVKDLSTIATPLNWLTQRGQAFQWCGDCVDAFARLQSALDEATMLAYPDLQRLFIVNSDESNMGLRAVLS